MIKKILQYPDPILKERSTLVEGFASNLSEGFSEETMRDIEDLTETMRASPGVGLAAVQTGVLKRIIAVDVTPTGSRKKVSKGTTHGEIVLVNPKIIETSGTDLVREGCLSIPEYTADIRRYQDITVTGLNGKGEEVTLRSSGFEAVALQHEIDHLDGILFIDRIESLRSLFKRKVRESAK
ncbi:MAG: peptide deformylase [Deltaproteobacteria bacterium]|nr:peptide deformylase [Deltaproteobacteria bacterium]